MPTPSLQLNNTEFSKEKIENEINKSTDYQELYDNALKILEEMEKELGKLGFGKDKEKESEIVKDTGLDGILKTDNPRNVFEKKAQEFLEKSQNIAEKSTCTNAIIQLSKYIGVERVNERAKNIIIQELQSTREKGKEAFQSDLEDKEKMQAIIQEGKAKGQDLFCRGAIFHKMDVVKEKIETMNTNDLILTTFNIENGSSAYELCYATIKTRLKGENLFDYINKQTTANVLLYSALNSLFSKRKTSDLYERLTTSRHAKEIYSLIASKLFNDKNFTISFLSSIDDIKSNPEMKRYFQEILTKIDQNETVKKAYQEIDSLDNADVFKTGTVQGLILYDNEEHGGGEHFFETEYKNYLQEGYKIILSERNQSHTTHVLQKGNVTLTMIKINTEQNITEDYIQKLVGKTQYNLFTMRGHCHNTTRMIYALKDKMEEGTILIDGGCRNALHTKEYYEEGVKSHILAYTGEGRGNSTNSLTKKIIQAVNEGKKFLDVLNSYNNIQNTNSADGYFASHSERPDSLVTQYKRLTAKK